MNLACDASSRQAFVTDYRRRVASVDTRVFMNLGGLGDQAWSEIWARRGTAAWGGSVRGVEANSPAATRRPVELWQLIVELARRHGVSRISQPRIAVASSRPLRTP